MHGRIEVDDSGFVHIAAVQEDRLLRYFRSTDYGVSFEPEVVFPDTIGGSREIVVTENNVYLYTINPTIGYPNPQVNLFVSQDKGTTWNLPTKFPFGAHPGVTARGDTVYDYQESGAGGSIYQARSYDSGATFQPYETVADTIYASIQTPKIAIGGNSILLCRVGDDVSLSDNFAYRSFDLGNTWLPPFNITPPNIDSQFPDVYFHSGKFHFSEGYGFAVYNRSDDYGNSFTPHWLLCLPTDNCAVDEQQQLTAHESNVFTTFLDPGDAPKDYLITRFSRDNGDNWSQVQLASQQAPSYLGIAPWYSTAVDDSIFYVVYVDDNGTPFESLKLRFRRGFYKFPFLSFEPDTLKINSQFLPSQLSTNFTVRNKGVIDLEISQIELPSWITLLSDSSFTLQPDSTKQIEIQLDLTQPLLEAELLFHTNQQIDSIRSFVVLVDTVITDLGEKENLPNKFSLSQNYPNPFNPTTTINYELGITNYEKSELIIYNILGEEVKSWKLSSSSGEVVWNGTDNFGNPVSSGVYLYRLTNGSFNKTKKMVLLK
ncbi:MAG: T9SS C-terminal target domain-containing protein [Calditrichaeota bacterium]|nr:MAG: T9SS C-terminal target domain-containing protein [Calditrichota bacterium]